ncbi:EAL domain-containing protein [Paenibacillus sp. FSL W8-1187]|uniref:Diguanylate cyclase/phosphodiesterase (GGDEF & EAL domains) with PAS/PAC sensor(S) n=1 Tax=Paenibacillus pasadenensis TaxID=217090 RepID=A0A2N5NDM3_9BACL|nr:EAL domain-containing protein [Paenibacillus pasadenensis]PLT48456.1 diguanylate cyclase/phosphodiesterase (GGDEF & EAL domains) with PAS/PAC sensor(s) [Paenibacillus pasadenensis]
MNHHHSLDSSYNIILVILSVAIPILASYATLDLGIHINKSRGRARNVWTACGAISMGMGIWSMHFIAMLALHLSTPVTYNPMIVLVSIVPALLASFLALRLISQPTMRLSRALLSALFMAAGIVSMHYVGMEAMQMSATVRYDPLLWGLSAAIAFIASLTALYLMYSVKKQADQPNLWRRKTLAAVVMGVAVASMHYTGMAAASFHDHGGNPVSSDMSSLNNSLLAYAIGIGMLIILAMVFTSTYVNRRFESQSLESERKFRSVIESASDAIILADSRTIIQSWNRGAQLMFGYTEKEAIGRPLEMTIPDRFKQAHADGLRPYLALQPDDVPGAGRTLELYGLRKDGTEFPIELSLAVWEEEGQPFLSSIIRDITERKKAEHKINQMVYLDPLTGLPNRHLLNDRLKEALDQADESGLMIGIMFLDLDRFKYINDTLGHTMGDLLLVEVSIRLRECVDRQDTVSRQGGDEFIVLLPGTSYEDMTRKAQRILMTFSQAILVGNQEMYVTPSIGLSLYPADGNNRDTLIKNADTAMYRVKEQGKNNFQFYTPEMNEVVSRRMNLEIGLRKGIQKNEFTVHYQPQVDIKAGAVVGVEALIRWQHPKLGLISPAEFIPLAEETGLIIPIGEWVLREACRQNKEWQDDGLPPLRIAVNISSRQFQQSGFAEVVSRALKETGLEPKYLELELTESIVQNSAHAISIMHKLKEMGIFLSIDDFGTGYSSLSYLKLFPIDSLKIDQSFTRNLMQDSKDEALVHTIINMAHNLGLKVIAEGVETGEQLQYLLLRHCHEAQGYYFSKPVPPARISELLGEQIA